MLLDLSGSTYPTSRTTTEAAVQVGLVTHANTLVAARSRAVAAAAAAATVVDLLYRQTEDPTAP